ncbi:uncharacterized protein KY384_002924 [Bacidia gigantensis]|uniref:uncharacterized protein n=1 Tax=Bacidia gigantensis TaxID=2732470 RepID=UPI001D046F0C|nr:uncharacterized protein KY384_002924 [Bacidia gigantensis]KAG8531296.1 hypothetical protein KY384_002924 [Bacidia gigantensis]
MAIATGSDVDRIDSGGYQSSAGGFGPLLFVPDDRAPEYMDPATIIGVTGAIVGIVDVIAKSISTLRDLRDRWVTISLTVSNLMTQLSSLKASLNKICEWISSDLSEVPQHHQLVIDLGEAVVCCRVLVNSMDEHLEQLKWVNKASPKIESKLRTLSEQKTYLERPEQRSALEKVRDDTSSMIVLHDDVSFADRSSISTKQSSKWSMTFPFDDDLMTSPVYQRAIRRIFRRTTDRPQYSSIPSMRSFLSLLRSKRDVETAVMMSDNIVERMRINRPAQPQETKILLTGSSNDVVTKLFYLIQAKEPSGQLQLREAMLGVVISAFSLFQLQFAGHLNKLSSQCLQPFERLFEPVSQTSNVYQRALATWDIWRQWPASFRRNAGLALQS